MHSLISAFTDQLKEALEIGSNKNFKHVRKSFQQVLVCGLGGSGIGGTILQKVMEKQLSIPLITNKDYHIPKFIGPESLVICCSYSGNTEESLMMFEQAKAKGAEVAIVCSGGTFREIAETNDINHLLIPGGLPPRAAFGLAFPQLFFVLHKYDLIDNQFLRQFQAAIQLLNKEEEDIQEKGRELAAFLHHKLAVIYSEARWEGVAIRFRQQINENAKMLCWHHVIPEMNHNELVGWRNKNEDLAVVMFKSEDDYYRNQKRFDYSSEVIKKYTSHCKDVIAKGDSFLEKCLYLIHLGDWCSYYLAEKQEIDSVEVDVIGGLKEMLASLK